MLPVEADMVSLAVIKVTDDAILKLTATEMALGDGVVGHNLKNKEVSHEHKRLS